MYSLYIYIAFILKSTKCKLNFHFYFLKLQFLIGKDFPNHRNISIQTFYLFNFLINFNILFIEMEAYHNFFFLRDDDFTSIPIISMCNLKNKG